MSRFLFPRLITLSEIHKLISLFLPLLLSQLTYALSTFIGTVMVAHLGTNALAALALVSSTYTTLCVFFYGIFVSISVLVSQHDGAKNKNGIEQAVSHGFILAATCSVFFIIIMLSAPALFQLAGQPTEVINLATPYLCSLSLSIFPWLLLVVMEQFLIGISLAKVVFWISLIQAPLEVLINYAFVFGKFGFPLCGIAGLGYGFTLVFTISVVFTGFFLNYWKKTRDYKIFKGIVKTNLATLSSLARVGLPIGSSNVIENLFFLVIVFLLGSLGATALAGQQIIKQYLELTITLGLALTQATTVRVGQGAGKKSKHEVNVSTYTSLFVGFVLMCFIATTYFFFPTEIISFDIDIHNPTNARLLAYTKELLFLAGIFQIFDCIRLVAMGALRGLNDTKYPMIYTTLAFWIIGFPCAYVLGFILKLEGSGVWLGILSGMIIATSLLLWRLRKFLRNPFVYLTNSE